MARRGPGAALMASMTVAVMAVALPLGRARAAVEAAGAASPGWLGWRAEGACTDVRGFAEKVARRSGGSADEAARRQGVSVAVEIRGGVAPSRWHAEVHVL